jgi:transketolase
VAILVIFGDGCAIEGVASEAASLAGHLQLGNLIAIHDDNHVCIDGDINSTFTEDVLKRFEAYGWHTQQVEDSNTDLNAISRAIGAAITVRHKPSVIKVTTTIGFGSLLQGTGGIHRSPLKADDIKQFKERVGISPEPFHVPDDVQRLYRKRAVKGAMAEARWQELFTAYGSQEPNLHAEPSQRLRGELPKDWEKILSIYESTDPAIAGRKLSDSVLSAV